MAVVTRRRGIRVLIAVAAGFPLLLAGGAALLTIVIGGTCTGSGVGDAPSASAIRDIPATFLRIYEQVGAQFKIPWEVLAGIGQEECDQGRLADPSCTPQPGATGPGVANFAGASGPMQIGVGGLAGNEYQSLRRYLPDPSLGPHDPTTAVELAALVLIRGKGAPVGQPIDAYALSVRAYNGSGPAADAYAARVLADAHAYQGAGTTAFGPSCSAALGIELESEALNPSDSPAALAAALVQVERLQNTIETLLGLARHAPAGNQTVDLGDAIRDLEARWHGPLALDGRPLLTAVEAASALAAMSPAVLAEIIDVLIENARTHGAGAISVTVRDVADRVAVDVHDQGPGFGPNADEAFRRGTGRGHGIGLALARSLAHSQGARLQITNPGPGPTVSLLIAPASE